MRSGNSTLLRAIVMIIAMINIVLMMVFEYGLPSPVEAAEFNFTDEVEETTEEGEENMNTIEAVAKEEARKETEAAEIALAKVEEEEDSETEVVQDPDAPILELTDDHIYLNVGERFNYMSYIKTMEDVDGTDLSHYIYLDKEVDTSVPGDIELTYRITSTITGKSTSKVLLITIQ